MIIAGERSGVGKTTLTLALLAFLTSQGHKVQAFKVGPDYIDPMFHTAITGISSRNLDPILTSPDYVQSCFTRHAQGKDYVLVEGVMGLFDGVRFQSQENYASTAHIATILELPIALVIDCSRLSGSVAAIAYGYAHFAPQVKIAGVILNKVGSDRHLSLLKSALETINMPILGIFRRNQDIVIPNRHLGLVPTDELPQMTLLQDKLATLAKTGFNWDLLLPLLKSSLLNVETNIGSCGARNLGQTQSRVKIGVARDRAFNFYYQDNFDILQELGAELIFWSPQSAQKLPEDISGIYFGGGFPEVFPESLEANYLVRKQIYQAIKSGMPIYAECGGLMYLCDRLVDFQGKSWEMVGAIPTTARMSPHLALGYRQAIPLQKSCLIDTDLNLILWGHEFHRSQLDTVSPQPLWQIQGCDPNRVICYEGWQLKQLHASYLHLHFGSVKTLLVERWIGACRNYRNKLR